jgi:hypothetical protein
MKYLLSLGLFFGLSLAGKAQIDLFVFGGPQATSARYVIDGVKQDTKYKMGAFVGVGSKMRLEGIFSFAPAIFYSLKGYKVDYNRSSPFPEPTALNNNVTLHTIEVAPLLQFDLSPKANHLFIKVGPSIDINIAGKEKMDLNNNTHVSRKMDFAFNSYSYIGASLIGQLGYEVSNQFNLSLQYALGVGSINNNENGPSIKHRSFGVSAGYFFKRYKTY